jgi:hypothetical protein
MEIKFENVEFVSGIVITEPAARPYEHSQCRDQKHATRG